METLFQSHLFKVVKKFIKGRSGQDLERHVILHPGAVVLLPVLPDGRLVFVKQPRVAVDETLIELPAGTLEPNEPPIETARRELIEETGYVASYLEEILTFYSSPGIMREKMHLFLAKELVPGPSHPEDGELIEPLCLEMSQALAMIESGEIKDAKTILGLLWFKQSRKL